MAKVGSSDSTYITRGEFRDVFQQMIALETSLATDAELTAHEADTTNVHGITSTANLVLKAELEGLASKAEAAANLLRFTSLKLFNVKDATYGAKGDGATDDATAIQSAINDAAAEGGEVYFPPGVYIIGSTLKWKSRVTLKGAGWEASEIKVKNGVNIVAIESEAYGAAGVYGCNCFDLRVNGNIENNPTGGDNFKLDGQSFTFERVLSINCKGDGFDNQITTETKSKTGGLDTSYVRCRAINVRGSGFRVNAHDTILVDCQAIQATEAGIKQEKNCYIVNSHAWCYSSEESTVTKVGFLLEGNAACVNCVSEGASEAEVRLTGGNPRWIGGEVFCSTGKPNVPCFEFNGATATIIDGPYVHNYGTGGAVKFTTDATQSSIKVHCFDPEAKPAGVGTPNENVYFDVTFGGSGGTGTMPSFRRQKITFGKFEPGSVENNTFYVHKASGRLKFKDDAGTTTYVKPTFSVIRSQDPWRPEGTKGENFSRTAGDLKNLAAALVSGTLQIAGGLILPADEAVGTIHLYTATTAALEPTHSWVVLLDSSRKILARSADKLTGAIAANSKISYALEASYTPSNKDEMAYVGILVTATTTPTLRGKEAENFFPYNQPPFIAAQADTGLTTPLAVGATAAAFTGSAKLPYITWN